MCYLQHRLSAQVVAPLSDGAFTCVDENSGHNSKPVSRGCERHKVARCLVRYLLLWVKSSTHNTASHKKRKKIKAFKKKIIIIKKRAALLTLLLFMFTPWLLGSTLTAPWSSIPICEGTTETAELFRVCATTFLFEIFFTVSKAAWK